MRGGIVAAVLLLTSAWALTDTAAQTTIVLEDILVTTADGTQVDGILAYPSDLTGVRDLVVALHGRGHNVQDSWTGHVTEIAGHGAVVIATNFRDNLGFPTMWGAEDTIAATQYALDRFPATERVTMFSVSMGSAIGGTAIAESAALVDGGLYDHWFNIEGVTNTLETYLEARAIGDPAADGMERDAGGSFEEVPEAYAERTPLLRVGEMGVEDVVMVHALYDGLVAHHQSRAFQTQLELHRIPSVLYTVLRENEGHPTGTTILDHTPLPDPNDEDELHLAGHATESDRDSLVMDTALTLLFEHLAGNLDIIGHGEYIVDRDARGGTQVGV